MGIVERSDVALGLVEHQVDLLLALHAAVVELHLVVGHHFRTQLGDYPAVDRNEPGHDEIVGLASRTDAGLGQIAVQAHLAGLLGGIVFGIGDGLVRALATGGAIAGGTAAPVVGGIAVAVFLRSELLGAFGTVTRAELAGTAFTVSRTLAARTGLLAGTTLAETVLGSVTGLLAIARFLAETGFLPSEEGPLVAVGFVAPLGMLAERTAGLAVELGTVVLREVGVVRHPFAALGRLLLRIGSVTLQTRATLDALRRGGSDTLALVASETRKHRRRVVFLIFHICLNCLCLMASAKIVQAECKSKLVCILPRRSLYSVKIVQAECKAEPRPALTGNRLFRQSTRR